MLQSFYVKFRTISFTIVLIIPLGLKTNNDSTRLWMIFDHAIRRVLIIKLTRVFASKIYFLFCDLMRSEKVIFHSVSSYDLKFLSKKEKMKAHFSRDLGSCVLLIMSFHGNGLREYSSLNRCLLADIYVTD